jgi:hypothetical protein
MGKMPPSKVFWSSRVIVALAGLLLMFIGFLYGQVSAGTNARASLILGAAGTVYWLQPSV